MLHQNTRNNRKFLLITNHHSWTSKSGLRYSV